MQPAQHPANPYQPAPPSHQEYLLADSPAIRRPELILSPLAIALLLEDEEELE